MRERNRIVPPKQKERIVADLQEQTNYFDKIVTRCNELTELGQKYIDSLPFIDNEEIQNRIFLKAKEIFNNCGENWNNVPEWVALTMDYAMPYTNIPENGSIHFALGFSIVAMEANLRNLLEIAEGRTTDFLNLPCVAERPKVN